MLGLQRPQQICKGQPLTKHCIHYLIIPTKETMAFEKSPCGGNRVAVVERSDLPMFMTEDYLRSTAATKSLICPPASFYPPSLSMD